MSWWKPLVVLVVPPVVMLLLQILLYQVVGVIEGSDDPMSATFTPLKLLAVNLSVGISGVVAILLLARLAKVPWRSLISSPRAFDGRRLAQYLLGAALLVGAGIGVVALVAPESPGWVAFGVCGTTILMLVITVLSTPLQSVGEELMFRSAVLPPPRPGCARFARPSPSAWWSPAWPSRSFTAPATLGCSATTLSSALPRD